MMQKKLVVLALIAAVGGAGCSTKMMQGVERDVDTTEQIADVYLNRSMSPHAMQRGSVEVKQGAWLPSSRVKVVDDQVGAEAGRRQITINREFHRLQEVAERVTLLTGIPVSISPEAIAPLAEEREAEDALNDLGNLPPVPGTVGGGQGHDPFAFDPRQNRVVNISYSGTLAGFLDVASSRFNVYWAWDDEGKRIRLFRLDTKVFRLSALPGNTRLTSSVSKDGSNSSSSAMDEVGQRAGSSSQQTEVSFEDLSVWDGVRDSIESMLTSSGAVTVTPATGTVTVTDTPHALAKVETFVREQNKSLGKQVTVNVRVLSVDLSDSDQYGVNWDLVYSSLSGRYGMGFASNFVPSNDATNLAMRVLSNAGDPGSRVSQWRGSEAIISALSSQGKVAQVTSAAVTTLNNQPVPVQVGRQTAYLASSETTLNDNQSTTALTPGTISTGFSMNLVPHIVDEEELLLQYAIDLSSLISIESITSGESTIQIPEIESRNFLQRVRINSGDTLVVTGFEQTDLDSNHQGIGSARNTWLGGGARGNRGRNVLVILIQPTISDS